MKNEDLVYILVEEANFPFCHAPRESEDLTLVVFTQEEDAKAEFERLLRGSHWPLPPPHKVLAMPLSSVLDLLDEMEVYAEEEYETGFIIELNTGPLNPSLVYSSQTLKQKQYLN